MLRADSHTRTLQIAGSRDVLAQPVHFSVDEFFRGGTPGIVQSREFGPADRADDRGV
jgi:hypothetical protein